MFTLNPIHHHCGPFNGVKRKKSKDPVDEACRRHDQKYGRYGAKAYLYHNKADEEFIQDMEGQTGILPKMYGGYFKVKKMVAPTLADVDSKMTASSSKITDHYKSEKRGRSRTRATSKTRHRSKKRAKSNVVGEQNKSVQIAKGRKEKGSGKGIMKHKKKSRKHKKHKIHQFMHAQKVTWELYNKFSHDVVNGDLAYGYEDIAANEACHAFIPLFTDRAYNIDFKIGESTSGSGLSGILDPPPAFIEGSGAVNGYSHNFIKYNEAIMIDKMYFKLIIANTRQSRFRGFVQEWVCNKSSDIDLWTRATALYNNQPLTTSNTDPLVGGYVGEANLRGIAAANLFKHPEFSMAKVPGLSAFWRKGLYGKAFELDPGEELEVVIPFSKIYWDRMKFAVENEDNNAPFEYHRGISRFIQIKTLGTISRDTGANNTTCFAAHGWNFIMTRRITAHRVDMWKPLAKTYYVNTGTVTEYYIASAARADYGLLPTPTGPVVQQQEPAPLQTTS